MNTISAFVFKVGARERLQSSRADAEQVAQISGEHGTVSGLILNLSRDGLAFTINQQAAYGVFSAQEILGEVVTVRYTTMDPHSRRRRVEASGIVVWSEVVADELKVNIRWG